MNITDQLLQIYPLVQQGTDHKLFLAQLTCIFPSQFMDRLCRMLYCHHGHLLFKCVECEI